MTKIEPLLDKNGIELRLGDIVLHGNNVFVVKYSENLNQVILRIKDDTGMNWRDLNWFKRVGKYCEIKR